MKDCFKDWTQSSEHVALVQNYTFIYFADMTYFTMEHVLNDIVCANSTALVWQGGQISVVIRTQLHLNVREQC